MTEPPRSPGWRNGAVLLLGLAVWTALSWLPPLPPEHLVPLPGLPEAYTRWLDGVRSVAEAADGAFRVAWSIAALGLAWAARQSLRGRFSSVVGACLLAAGVEAVVLVGLLSVGGWAIASGGPEIPASLDGEVQEVFTALGRRLGLRLPPAALRLALLGVVGWKARQASLSPADAPG